MTGAISSEGPKEIDLQLTRDLEQYLRDNDVFESPKEEELRCVWESGVEGRKATRERERV